MASFDFVNNTGYHITVGETDGSVLYGHIPPQSQKTTLSVGSLANTSLWPSYAALDPLDVTIYKQSLALPKPPATSSKLDCGLSANISGNTITLSITSPVTSSSSTCPSGGGGCSANVPGTGSWTIQNDTSSHMQCKFGDIVYQVGPSESRVVNVLVPSQSVQIQFTRYASRTVGAAAFDIAISNLSCSGKNSVNADGTLYIDLVPSSTTQFTLLASGKVPSKYLEQGSFWYQYGKDIGIVVGAVVLVALISGGLLYIDRNKRVRLQ